MAWYDRWPGVVRIVKAEFLPGVSYPPFSCRADPFLAFETESFRVFFKPAGMHSIPASSEAGKHLPSGARRKLPGLEIPESPFQSDLDRKSVV